MLHQEFTAQSLAERWGGVLKNCPPDRVLTDILPLEQAGPGALSFLVNSKFLKRALETSAGLVLTTAQADLGSLPQLVLEDPQGAFVAGIQLFHPEPPLEHSEGPIHPTASLAPDVMVGHGATVGARTILGPGVRLHAGVHIEADCVVGEGCELFPGAVLYRRTILGKHVRVHANTVLGSDGFGYTSSQAGHRKIPHVGWVEVGDDVEIGACVTVDRGVLGPTRIGRGTKIDNLCQIAHNVILGEHCLLASQVGISGSTVLGDFVTLAGKVGTAGHLHIGSRSIATGNSMIAKDLPEGSFVSGYLARPHREWMANQAALNRLPAILKGLRHKD